MDNQNIFNTVCEHLIKQNEKCLNPNYNENSESSKCLNPNYNENSESSKCLYIGPDNKRCAFGCLIPDELYDEKMEGKVAHAVIINHIKLREHLGIPISVSIFDEPFRLLDMLQSVHDNDEVEDWKSGLQNVGRCFSLDYPDCIK